MIKAAHLNGKDPNFGRAGKLRNLLIYMVARAGIEPATQGFSILCSTD
jgi:hypothetical protein